MNCQNCCSKFRLKTRYIFRVNICSVSKVWNNQKLPRRMCRERNVPTSDRLRYSIRTRKIQQNIYGKPSSFVAAGQEEKVCNLNKLLYDLKKQDASNTKNSAVISKVSV